MGVSEVSQVCVSYPNPTGKATQEKKEKRPRKSGGDTEHEQIVIEKSACPLDELSSLVAGPVFLQYSIVRSIPGVAIIYCRKGLTGRT